MTTRKMPEVGERFGRLVVVTPVVNETGKTITEFICDCGRTTRVPFRQVSSGGTSSCGCLRRELISSRSKKEFVVGETFGLWTVLVPDYSRDKNQKQYVLCQCACGTTKAVSGGHLSSGKSSCCGCLGVQRMSTMNASHHMSQSSEYNIWSGMKTRCNNPNCERYEDYGGAGITVCPRWEDSFEAFYTDMGPRPSTDHSIDRIDNSKGYSPENCRWATDREQILNRDKAITLTLAGETKFLADWCVERGLNYRTAYYRMMAGAPAEEVLLPGSVRVSHKNRMPDAVGGNAA